MSLINQKWDRFNMEFIILVLPMKYYTSDWTDHMLLDVIRQHDDHLAFAELYHRYWKKIFDLAVNSLQSPEMAEECVQDIFCSLWTRRSTLQLKYSLYTYLAAAVKYKTINMMDKIHRKEQKRAYLIFATDLVSSAETPLLEKEFLDSLNKAINQLSEKCRIVFKMSREEGKKHKQIAKELNISEKTVNNHLTKALKDLNRHLS